MDSETAILACPAQAVSNAGDKVASLFQPDTLLPMEFFESARRNPLLEPEQKLALAILKDAISCYQENCFARCGRSKRVFDQAQEWIFHTGDDWIFSFENICGALGLSPEYIRGGLALWRKKKLSMRPGVPVGNGA